MPRGFAEFLLRDRPYTAYRHLRDDPSYDVLDFSYAAVATDNRWNHAGEPTLYLASDPAVAVGEFSRHLDLERSPLQVVRRTARRVYELRLYNAGPFLDLRDPRLWDALHLEDDEIAGYRTPWHYDKRRARAVGAYLRHVTAAKGLVVPSMAFPDVPEACCLVLFLEKLPADPRAFLTVESSIAIDIS